MFLQRGAVANFGTEGSGDFFYCKNHMVAVFQEIILKCFFFENSNLISDWIFGKIPWSQSTSTHPEHELHHPILSRPDPQSWNLFGVDQIMHLDPQVQKQMLS
jgi:hypothetical protein